MQLDEAGGFNNQSAMEEEGLETRTNPSLCYLCNHLMEYVSSLETLMLLHQSNIGEVARRGNGRNINSLLQRTTRGIALVDLVQPSSILSYCKASFIVAYSRG